jgi:hypothetical protein
VVESVPVCPFGPQGEGRADDGVYLIHDGFDFVFDDYCDVVDVHVLFIYVMDSSMRYHQTYDMRLAKLTTDLVSFPETDTSHHNDIYYRSFLKYKENIISHLGDYGLRVYENDDDDDIREFRYLMSREISQLLMVYFYDAPKYIGEEGYIYFSISKSDYNTAPNDLASIAVWTNAPGGHSVLYSSVNAEESNVETISADEAATIVAACVAYVNSK